MTAYEVVGQPSHMHATDDEIESFEHYTLLGKLS